MTDDRRREEHRDLENLRQLKAAVEQKPNWHFRLYVVPPSSGQDDLNDITDVDKLIETADRLNQEGQFEAAAVVLWIALETSLRVLLTHRQSRPNPGASGVSMARRLYADGDLDDADLDLLTIASEARNRSAHGYRLKPRRPLQTDLFDLAKTLARKAKSAIGAAGKSAEAVKPLIRFRRCLPARLNLPPCSADLIPCSAV